MFKLRAGPKHLNDRPILLQPDSSIARAWDAASFRAWPCPAFEKLVPTRGARVGMLLALGPRKRSGSLNVKSSRRRIYGGTANDGLPGKGKQVFLGSDPRFRHSDPFLPDDTCVCLNRPDQLTGQRAGAMVPENRLAGGRAA